MLHLGTSRPPKPGTRPPASLMQKGLRALWAVADRDRHALGTQSELGESAQAAGWFSRRLVRARGAWEVTRFSGGRKASGAASPGSPKLVLVTSR